MEFGHRMRMAVELPERLTVEERERIAAHEFGLRLELILALRQERYEPRATCPQCDRRLTPIEILRGFNDDPTDYTTRCTGCGCRFEPTVICFRDGSAVTFPFLCAAQTLAQLSGKETLTPEQFSRDHAAAYRSAIVHFGSVRAAFAAVGIAYAHGEDVGDWTVKVTPFLGRLPDTIIAAATDQSVYAVRRLRHRLGTERYRACDYS